MFILLPTQLFKNIKLLKNHNVYLVEDEYYFKRLQFHKLKIAYHRATMKKYYSFLKINNINVSYIDFYKSKSFYNSIKNKIFQIYHPIDIDVHLQFKKLSKNITIHPTLNFTFNHTQLSQMKKSCFKNNKYYHDLFYKHQRHRLNILIKDNKPIKGKYSFDNLNRKTYPNNILIPDLPKIKSNKFIKEAIKYTNTHFSKNYGSLQNFIYPIDHKNSEKWLKIFLKQKLINYGPYQDAVNSNPFGFHSVISPMMNIGLLNDMDVINISQKYYLKNKSKIPINSYEGFIRQIIGWRNYVYLIYLLEGNKIRKMNHLKHNNKIKFNQYNKFWTAQTNITPIDNIIKKIIDYGYAHHIERLMYLGNFLLISQIHPSHVYRLFMEWTIDSYDWVMVPNVYGMTQFADGGIMMTRIYFSSSNYIFKMSNYKKSTKSDDKWWEIWDALYYNFINKHYNLLSKNYATSRQALHWKNKSKTQQLQLIKTSKLYFKYLL